MNSRSIYRINAADELIHVNSAYLRFAYANGAPELATVHLARRSLWDFIGNSTTRQLYRQILQSARQGKPVRLPFRCDSPTCRRQMELQISSSDGQIVEFQSRTLSTHDREIIPLLSPVTPRSGDMITACSWCNRINAGTEWLEVEDAVVRMGLFNQTVLPQLTHGICAGCLTIVEKCVGE